MLKLILLSLFTLFTSILSKNSVEEISIKNFVELVKNDKSVWVLAVVKKSNKRCQKIIPEFEEMPSKIDYINFGIVDLDTPEGKELFEGVTLKVPSTLIFNSLNPKWDFITTDREFKTSELTALVDYKTKNLEIVGGKKMKKADDKDDKADL